MTKIKEIKSNQSPAAIGPYSQAIRIGDLIITSGQLPLSPQGKLSDDVKEQTCQSLKNIQAILEEAGSGMNKVVKCTVFISDMNDFPKINEVYQTFFNQPYPARSCVEVSRLPEDVKVEIEAIAMTD